MPLSAEDYRRTCFVVMPYGVKAVKRQKIDFDAIYSDLFKPAIQRVRVKDSVRLAAYRADQGAHSRLLHDTMFYDLLHCRLALVDITGGNANVIYETGVRHAILKTGTVIVRQPGTAIPFNLADVSIPEYRHKPAKAAEVAIAMIAVSLRETLRQNEADSPAYAAAQTLLDRMGPPGSPTKFGEAVLDAEKYARDGDVRRAAQLYARAAELEPDLPLPHDRRGVLLRQAGEHLEAISEFRRAWALRAPDSAAALKEGIGVNLEESIAKMIAKPKKLDFSTEMQRMIDRIGKRSNQINVQIEEGKHGTDSKVFVISPTDVHWTGAVPQVLTKFGKVSDQGAKEFTDKGYVVSKYTIAKPTTRLRTTTTDDLTSGLDELKALGSNVKIGRFGGKGGGGFGGGGFEL